MIAVPSSTSDELHQDDDTGAEGEKDNHQDQEIPGRGWSLCCAATKYHTASPDARKATLIHADPGEMHPTLVPIPSHGIKELMTRN